MLRRSRYPAATVNDAPIRKIAINTGGGDAPGLNAVIRATVLAAENRGWECTVEIGRAHV